MTADLQSALVAAGEHPNVFALNCGCKGKQKKRNAKHIAHFLRYFLFFTPFCYTPRAFLNVIRAFSLSQMSRNKACFSSAMARKGAMKWNVLCTPKALYISSMAPRIGILVDVEPHDVDKQPRHGGHEKKMPFV